MKLKELLKKKILVSDGAMGTMLQKNGFTSGSPDELNISDPELIKSIHKKYSEAGANIIITNTFGANRLKLKEYGLQDSVDKVNKAAIDNARAAAPDKIIAGDIGPLGQYLDPLGEITFDKAYEIFAEQVKALSTADVLIIETVSDIRVLKVAIIAAKENSELPIICNMTFEDNGRTATGTDAKTYAAVADALDVDVIGINCGGGPKEAFDIAKILVKNTNKPIMIQPNAGIPEVVDEKTVFPALPKELGDYAVKFAEIGVNILGGCCGTTPEHIAAIAKSVEDLKPKERKNDIPTRFCSRTKTVECKYKTLLVGERINPTGRKSFREEIKNGKTNIIRDEALAQKEEGASLLDINVGVPGIDETEALKTAVRVVQNTVDLPIVIDSSKPEALEEALKQSDGKPLINSVNAREESLSSVIPLAKKYGAAILVLTLEKDIPKTAEDRVAIAEKIIKRALETGIKKEDIVVDTLTLTIATNPENEEIILDAVKRIKKLGYKTILGVSNISHGLPNRAVINTRFLEKASSVGLDLAIVNPLDRYVKDEGDSVDFEIKKAEKSDYEDLAIEKKLHNAIIYGDEDNIIQFVEEALKEFGVKDALKINDTLLAALDEVGAKFKKKEYFLPQVLLSAAAMKKAFSRLKEEINDSDAKTKGKVLIATVKNDIHDIGKNILSALLESHGFTVIDLGKDVSEKEIVDAAKDQNPDVICLSALMTTTAAEMENVINELNKNNINVPVMVGGAVITPDYADQIKAKYAKDAMSAVKKVEEIIRGNNK